MQSEILCIGSVLWDVIGRSTIQMHKGNDVPGRITRLPGGVAMNVAMTLARFGMAPVLLSAVGRDNEGVDLMATCARMGMGVDYIYRSDDLPTDRYMAVEGANGLIAAIADAHSLEAAGAKILTALRDGRLGSIETPYKGTIVLDGNLTTELLVEISNDPCFAQADLRVAPASPGKAERLLPFVTNGGAVLYVNLEEAGLLCRCEFDNARTAAEGVLVHGAARVLVTDGGNTAAEGSPHGIIEMAPPNVSVARVTGAGDTFMAAHIAAENDGHPREAALTRALQAAATYVSGETTI